MVKSSTNIRYEKGGFERPAGKPPGVLESLSITRAAWQFDALTQRFYLACPSARDWEEAPPPALGAAGGAR
jgi:hypothetical protein